MVVNLLGNMRTTVVLNIERCLHKHVNSLVTAELAGAQCSNKFVDKLSRCITITILGPAGSFEEPEEDDLVEQCSLGLSIGVSFARWKLSERCRNIVYNYN